MRNKFDEQLLELNQEMTKMGNMIEESIAKAVEALYKRDNDLAKQIMESDTKIDRAQKKIEDICFNLLIQQQPVARDLRNITAAMKMVTDMERIGDHAADISEMSLYIGEGRDLPKFEHINQMASETVMMLNWSIEAYVSKDRQKANEVISHDDVVDRGFDQVKRTLIEQLGKPETDGEAALDLLMIAKYFERIGDHAVNIAQRVLFSMTGSREGGTV